MATILFVMKYPLHRQENLKGKFDGQLAAVRGLGHQAYAIGWDEEGMWLLGDGTRELLQKNPLARMPGYDHTVIFADLMAAALRALREKPIDAMYLRYMPTFRSAVKTVEQLKKQGGKLILEFPTYPREQENSRSLLRRPVFAYADRVLKRIHPMVDLYTLIGEPCDGQLDGRPAMNIVNGIHVEGLPLHVANGKDPTVRLLALASMAGWHGYDRILRSLAAYEGPAKVELHFVGGDGDGSLAKWQQLAQELGLQGRARFHGPLYGDALNETVARCDVGVGSLGMFRFGLHSGMTLKLREYMARGLPFVYAVDDPAIPEGERFCLRAPNDESPISMEKIVAFAAQSKADAGLPADMRAYARAHMSWEGVLKAALEAAGL